MLVISLVSGIAISIFSLLKIVELYRNKSASSTYQVIYIALFLVMFIFSIVIIYIFGKILLKKEIRIRRVCSRE